MERKAKHTDADKALGPMTTGKTTAEYVEEGMAGEREAAENFGRKPAAVRRTVAKDQANSWDQIAIVAGTQCRELLYKHAQGIEAAYAAAIEDIDDDKKQKYGVTLGVAITGDDPTHYSVRTKISYAVKTSDSAEDQVAVGEDLVDQMGGEE